MRNKVVNFLVWVKKQTPEQPQHLHLFWGPIVHQEPSAAQMPFGIQLTGGIPQPYEAQCPIDYPWSLLEPHCPVNCH